MITCSIVIVSTECTNMELWLKPRFFFFLQDEPKIRCHWAERCCNNAQEFYLRGIRFESLANTTCADWGFSYVSLGKFRDSTSRYSVRISGGTPLVLTGVFHGFSSVPPGEFRDGTSRFSIRISGGTPPVLMEVFFWSFLRPSRKIPGWYLSYITTDSFQILYSSPIILPFDAI
jgi:hypothetical protein